MKSSPRSDPMEDPLKSTQSHPSFAELMADHQPRLSGYIRSLVVDEHAAKDVLQETNVTLLKKSDDFEPGTNFLAWAFRVAFFEVLKWRRGKGRSRLQFSTELIESIGERVEEVAPAYEDRLSALQSCLKELPERQKEAVERRYLRSQSVTEIASDLGFKPNAASQLLFRARANLLKCIRGKTAGSRPGNPDHSHPSSDSPS